MENPSDDMINQLSGYMRIGAGYLLATAACGVPEKTARMWLEKAQKAKSGVFKDFHEAMRVAKAQAEVIALQRLAAEGGASGAKTVLEIINPEKYGKHSKKQEEDLGSDDLCEWFNGIE